MATRSEELHGTDFYAWTRDQAEALRRLAEERWNGPLDLLNLAEEIEDVGNDILNGVLSQLERIALHLLKLEHAASPRPRRQWILSVRDGRRQVERRLTKAMRRQVEPKVVAMLAAAAGDARLQLLDQHEREAAQALPPAPSYTLDQLLDGAWYPASRHGHVDDEA